MASWKSLLSRWVSSDTQAETEQLRASPSSSGCIQMCSCELGQRATLLGIVRSVSLEPASALPRLEAVVSDGTGTARLVWLGRRRIGGIEPGRRVRVTGRVVGREEGHEPELVLYNPRYELLPSDLA